MNAKRGLIVCFALSLAAAGATVASARTLDLIDDDCERVAVISSSIAAAITSIRVWTSKSWVPKFAATW